MKHLLLHNNQGASNKPTIKPTGKPTDRPADIYTIRKTERPSMIIELPTGEPTESPTIEEESKDSNNNDRVFRFNYC